MGYKKDETPSYELMPDWRERYEYEPRKIMRILLQSHVGIRTILTTLGKTREQICVDLGFYERTTDAEGKAVRTADMPKLLQFIRQCRASGRATLQVWTYCQAETSLNGAMAMRAEIKRRGDAAGVSQIAADASGEIAKLTDDELLERFQKARVKELSEKEKLKRAAKAVH